MKHNQMNAFVGFMIVLATITIVAVVTYRIMSTAKTQEYNNDLGVGCNATSKVRCGAAYNAVGSLEEANDEVIDWLPIYIIAAVGFLIIGLFAYSKMS